MKTLLLRGKQSEVFRDTSCHLCYSCIVDASGLVKIWHYTSGHCLHTSDELIQTLCSSVNMTRDRYVTGGASQQLTVYDTETNQKMFCLEAR